MKNHNGRRRFLQQLSTVALGGVLLPDWLIKQHKTIPGMIPQSDNDQAFWKAIRQQFPLSTERVYFNNGTMGPTPYPVLQAVEKGLAHLAETGEYLGSEAARTALPPFLGVKEEEISLTHNTTDGINVVAWGLPLKKGDEVIMTTHEHVGNALPWLNRAKLQGIVIRTFQPALTSAENLERIKALVNKKTRVIAVPHITCTTGTVLPVKEISALAKEKGIFSFIDGAHGTGSMPLNLKDIGCDFYASCTHKWLCGPSGTGFLYVREGLLDTVQALFVGGYSGDFDITTNPPVIKPFVPNAHRYDYATQNAALYKGVAEAVKFMDGIGMEKIKTRIYGMAKYLQDKLLNLNNVEMLTPTEEASRCMMIGFRLKNMDFHKFGELATKEHFRIRLVPESHLDSIRISTHIYNNESEIDRFVEIVKG